MHHAHVEVRCDWQIRLAWILTACLFAAGVLFAAGAGYVLSRANADRAVQLDQIQATETNNARQSRILGILEDDHATPP